MSQLEFTMTTAKTPAGREVCTVDLSGIISTPTLVEFREQMENPLATDRDVILNLEQVSYINSTGLGEFVRMHSELQGRNLSLVLVSVDPATTRLLKMLGLEQVLPLFGSHDEAFAGIDSGRVSPALQDDESVAPVPQAPPAARTEGLQKARILLALGDDPHLNSYFETELEKHGATVTVACNADDARNAIATSLAEIAIFDSSFPACHYLTLAHKSQGPLGLVSLVAIYPDSNAAARPTELRVAPDEVLVEPFEVEELVAVAAREARRRVKEATIVNRELTLHFPTVEEAILEAVDVISAMIRESDLPSTAADEFIYASREAVDNARRHGNKLDLAKSIRVRLQIDSEMMTLSVTDEGSGFDWDTQIRNARAKPPLQQARERHELGGYGGLGIGLMLRCCDELTYQPPGNTVRLAKYF